MSFRDLQRRVELGRLKPDDLVCPGRQGKWVRARKVDGLIHEVEKDVETFYVNGKKSAPLFGAILIVIATTTAAWIRLQFQDGVSARWLFFGWLFAFLLGLLLTRQTTVTLCRTQYGRRFLKTTKHFVFLAWSTNQTDLKKFKSIVVGGAASGTSGPLSGVFGTAILLIVVMGIGLLWSGSIVRNAAVANAKQGGVTATGAMALIAAMIVLAVTCIVAAGVRNRDSGDRAPGQLSVSLTGPRNPRLLVYSGKYADELRSVANRLEKATGLRSRNG